MRIMALAAVAASLLSSGVIAAEPLVATVTGPARNCVNLQSIRNTNVIDDQTIDFVMRDGTVLRNTLPGKCPQLSFDRSFSYRTSLSQLCSVDIITVLQQTGGGLGRGASCGLGKFTPVALAAK